jgi:hypothetical protein
VLNAPALLLLKFILYYITGRTGDSSAPNFPLRSARIWKRFQFSTRNLGHIHDGVDVMEVFNLAPDFLHFRKFAATDKLF